MYIISKKKDYYDGVVGTMGVDKEIVYERKTIEITNENDLPKEFKRPDDIRPQLKGRNHLLNLEFYRPHKKNKYKEAIPFIVGFCGKLYVGFKLEYEINKEFYTDTKTDIVYNIKKIKKYIKNEHWGRVLMGDINYIQNYDAMHVFREYNTPAFIFDFDYTGEEYNKPTFIVKPLLKEHEFYKVFDSFRAFQEIQMFISGVLGNNEKDMVEISDIDKIQQHGYDKKWSFRKEPTKKRKK